MKGAPARVHDGGRVTIPVDVRRHIGVEPGDYVYISVQPLNGGEAIDE